MLGQGPGRLYLGCGNPGRRKGSAHGPEEEDRKAKGRKLTFTERILKGSFLDLVSQERNSYADITQRPSPALIDCQSASNTHTHTHPWVEDSFMRGQLVVHSCRTQHRFNVTPSVSKEAKIERKEAFLRSHGEAAQRDSLKTKMAAVYAEINLESESAKVRESFVVIVKAKHSRFTCCLEAPKRSAQHGVAVSRCGPLGVASLSRWKNVSSGFDNYSGLRVDGTDPKGWLI